MTRTFQMFGISAVFVMCMLSVCMITFTLGFQEKCSYIPLRSTRKSIPVMNLKHSQRQPSATLVTALYNIGRSEWKHFSRSFHTYLKYFKNVLKLGTKLVIYCEKSTNDILTKMYGDMLNSNISVVIKPFYEIEFEQYRQIIKHIMKSEEFVKDNEMLKYPQGFSVDYILLVNNKISFILDSVRRNTFDSTHFFWIDGGFGHGNSNLFSNHLRWSPSKLLLLNKTVTFTKLNDLSMYANTLTLHKQNLEPAISAGFFGGHIKAVTEFYHLFNKIFRSMLTENVVNDEQSVFVACYYELPRLFNLVNGDWFDALKLHC